MVFFQDFLQFFHTHLIETLVIGVFALFSWMCKKSLSVIQEHLALKRQQAETESNEQGLLKVAMLALLRFRINHLCYDVLEQGYITLDQKSDIDDMFKAYHALGGNGRTHLLYEEVLKLQVKEITKGGKKYEVK